MYCLTNYLCFLLSVRFYFLRLYFVCHGFQDFVSSHYKDAEKKSKRTQLEIDFVANKGSKKYYIQSALTVADEEKREQEIRSLKRVGDSFKKIVVVKDNIIPWHDDDGILYIGIEQFLLDESAMDM